MQGVEQLACIRQLTIEHKDISLKMLSPYEYMSEGSKSRVCLMHPSQQVFTSYQEVCELVSCCRKTIFIHLSLIRQNGHGQNNERGLNILD